MRFLDERPRHGAVGWAAWAQIHLTPVMERLLLAGQILPGAERDVADMRPALRQFRRGLALLEQSLPASSPFVNGVGFSLADITLGATLSLARLIPETTLRLARFPRTQAYLEGLEARASFAEAFGGITLPPTPPPDLLLEFPA
jgi:glutathione S-transferase